MLRRRVVIQQIASTVTYLQRYTLLAITGMSTKGMDDDAAAAGEHVDADALADWREAFADATTKDELEGYRDQVRKLENPLRKNVIALFTARERELSA